MLQVRQGTMASGLALQMVLALIAQSSFLFHPANLHFRLILYRPWPALLLGGIPLDAQSSSGWSSLANSVSLTLLPIQSCNGNYQLNKVSWPSPKLLQRSLLVPAMPKRMRATPRLGRGGRGGSATDAHSQPAMVSWEGYDRSVPSSIRKMLDDWEEEMTSFHPATQHTQRRQRSYWTVKNLLARSLLSLHGVFLQSPSNSPRSPRAHSPSSDSQHNIPAPSDTNCRQTTEAQPVRQGAQAGEVQNFPSMQKVQHSDLQPPSSFTNCTGLPTKEAQSSSSSDSDFTGCSVVEEIPPGGLPV